VPVGSSITIDKASTTNIRRQTPNGPGRSRRDIGRKIQQAGMRQQKAGDQPRRQRTRVSANTSGSDSKGGAADETADQRPAPNKEPDNHLPRSLPDRLPARQALPGMTVQSFDLMSRRHPLRRPEPAPANPLREANRRGDSRDVAGSMPPAVSGRRVTSSSWQPSSSSWQSSSPRTSLPSSPS
jgi:hypothetical protein